MGLAPSPYQTGHLLLPATPALSRTVLRWCRDPALRRDVYIASHRSAPENLQHLQALLDARADLARTLGFDSFAQFSTMDTVRGLPRAAAEPRSVTPRVRAAPPDGRQLPARAVLLRGHQRRPAAQGGEGVGHAAARQKAVRAGVAACAPARWCHPCGRRRSAFGDDDVQAWDVDFLMGALKASAAQENAEGVNRCAGDTGWRMQHRPPPPPCFEAERAS